MLLALIQMVLMISSICVARVLLLSAWKYLTGGAKKYLKEGGYLILETGIGQSEEIEEVGREAGFSDITTVRDYAGIDRVIRLMQECV